MIILILTGVMPGIFIAPMDTFHRINTWTKKAASQPISNKYVHYTFTILGFICYGIFIYDVKQDSESSRKYSHAVQDLTYLITYRIFYIYLILDSIRRSNVYEFFIAIFVLIQKQVVLAILIFKKDVFFGRKQMISLILLLVLCFLEACYAIAIVFIRRRKINMQLFKISGASPEVNKAHAIRNFVKVLGILNWFLMVHYSISDLVFYSFLFSFNHYLRYGNLILGAIQLIVTFAEIDEENVTQRYLAFLFTVIRLLYFIGNAICFALLDNDNEDSM